MSIYKDTNEELIVDSLFQQLEDTDNNNKELMDLTTMIIVERSIMEK